MESTMRTSYAKEDVCLLLKDITGLVEPLPSKEREKLIQKGMHYCEMLPIEYEPGKAYMEAYDKALESYAGAVARAVGVLKEIRQIMKSNRWTDEWKTRYQAFLEEHRRKKLLLRLLEGFKA